MSLLKRFKKDYFNYLISIIIPALINAVSIPLFKRILGAESYGYFAITFNSILLLAALLSSWIMQSVIRYAPAIDSNIYLVKKALLFTLFTQAVFFLPVVYWVYQLRQDMLMAILFGAALIVLSLQYVVVSLGQAFFLSKKSIFSEFIRAVSYISIALLLLTCTKVYFIYSLFAGLLVSFLLSGLYLFVQIKKMAAAQPLIISGKTQPERMFKSFLQYGGPISLWFVFSYSITLVDKYFMLHALGANSQGNYQALFDLLSKSITMVCSPVIISLFPLITEAYQSNRTGEIKKLLAKIIFIELGVLIISLIAYWWFGFAILSMLIKVPDTTEYKLMGEIIIAGSFIWQMAIVVHKYQEMKFRNVHLLAMITVAFIMQLCFYWLFKNNTFPLLYPTGYALAAIIYLILVSSGVIKSLVSSNINPQLK